MAVGDGHAPGHPDMQFLDRLITIALPRVATSRRLGEGLPYDGQRQLHLGLRDQLMFPEIDYMKVDRARDEYLRGHDHKDRRKPGGCSG